MKISILGAGSWGSALASSLSESHTVTLWNAFPSLLQDISQDKQNKRYLPDVPLDKVLLQENLSQAVSEAQLIFLVVPSKFARSVLEQLAPHCTEQHILVSAAKGLELNPIRTMTDLAEEILPCKKGVVALSGPTHAEDVGAKKFSCLVAASKTPEAAQRVQEAVSCPWIRVYTGDDPTGVEIGAAVKNIIAIAAGIVVQGGYGDNALAALVTRGLMEMTRFGVFLGGKPQTFTGLAGIGDLTVTCYSDLSRNRYVGRQIALGRSVSDIEASMTQVPEGVRAAAQVHRIAQENNISMPIVESVYRILYENLSLKQWGEILTDRPFAQEYTL